MLDNHLLTCKGDVLACGMNIQLPYCFMLLTKMMPEISRMFLDLRAKCHGPKPEKNQEGQEIEERKERCVQT